MSDLFEDDDIMDPVDCLEKIEVEPELKPSNLKDARIRLEKKLDERNLRKELKEVFEDSIDY